MCTGMPLKANTGISSPGVKLHGSGFIVTREQAAQLGLGRIPGLEQHIREYRNGRDLTATPRDVLVIDLFGLTIEEVRTLFPEVYQWILGRVKPERSQNRDPLLRDRWWLHRRLREDLRAMLDGLGRFIATVETSKHRFFTFLDCSILPDNKLINLAVADPWHLGILSSRIHVTWALRTGSLLEDRPVYPKRECFETFPFPPQTETAARADEASNLTDLQGSSATQTIAIDELAQTATDAPSLQSFHEVALADNTHINQMESAPDAAADTAAVAPLASMHRGPSPATSPAQVTLSTATASIAELAEQIDAHRKRQQELHPTLTLTNLYNVLERLRRIAHPRPGATEPEPPLTDKERSIHDQGLVSILAQLHDELDAAVLTAYGWEDLAPALVGRPGGTTPYPDKPAEQAAAEEELLTRLVALNRQRAAEEAQGRVRWLRPMFQDPTGATRQQTEADVGVARWSRRQQPSSPGLRPYRHNSKPCATGSPNSRRQPMPSRSRASLSAHRPRRLRSCSRPSPPSAKSSSRSRDGLRPDGMSIRFWSVETTRYLPAGNVCVTFRYD